MAKNLKEELIDVRPLVDVLAGPDVYRQLPMLIRNAILSQEEGLDRKGLAVDLSEDETYHDVIPDRNDRLTVRHDVEEQKAHKGIERRKPNPETGP